MVDKVWDMVISSVCAFVCLYVRALKGKWLELSTPKFGHWGPLAAIKGFLLLRGGKEDCPPPPVHNSYICHWSILPDLSGEFITYLLSCHLVSIGLRFVHCVTLETGLNACRNSTEHDIIAGRVSRHTTAH